MTTAECECGCGTSIQLDKRWVRGHHGRGKKRSPETNAKIRAAKLGTKLSPETRAKMRAAKLGTKHTAEHNAKIGAAQRGAKSATWKGGRSIDYRGYVTVTISPDHPLLSMAVRRGTGGFYVLEHRLVMAEYLGRPLTRREVVHHRLACEGGSGDPTDNRIENLRLFASQAEHRAHHWTLNKRPKPSAAVDDPPP